MLARLAAPRQVRLLSGIGYIPPKLDELSKRWPEMSGPLKEEIVEYLTWRMEDSWKTMPREEIKAAYFISYGPWGPRSPSGQGQLSPAFLVWKGLFNAILFLALGVSIVNLKRDKELEEKLKRLEEQSDSSGLS
ncbi:hypothetical protein HG536_0D05720 [Torulaspora globosa]|uniref:Uncharacterized protein n=1 Tax=Torulaspora globosa TaxID=48254 RepID=A0A7G3ZHR5_9SACH|nr:uncharacterized protein HG536_0D05720 [Torulaspora globosa]QLL33051.1 hypothetical protein HG536_0D05720 [Torulaspora globosa]